VNTIIVYHAVFSPPGIVQKRILKAIEVSRSKKQKERKGQAGKMHQYIIYPYLWLLTIKPQKAVKDYFKKY
jgi:hypothetical protein